VGAQNAGEVYEKERELAPTQKGSWTSTHQVEAKRKCCTHESYWTGGLGFCGPHKARKDAIKKMATGGVRADPKKRNRGITQWAGGVREESVLLRTGLNANIYE